MEKSRTGDFKSFGEYLCRVRRAYDGEGTPDSRLKTTGHMEIGVDSQGGALVPEQWAEGIYHAGLEKSIVRPRAVVLGATSDSLKLRRLVDSDRSSSIFGGVTFTWMAEAADKSDTRLCVISKPAIGELELTPHKLIGAMYASNELEDDYGAFGEFMRIAFGRAVAFIEDDYFIWGAGGGQPLGIMNSGAMISIARTNNTGPPLIQDFAALAERLLPDSWPTAVWLISQTVLEDLTDDATAGGNAGGSLDLSTMTAFSRPIIVTEKCSASGTSGDVILADFGQYVIADREMSIAGSRHVKAYGDYGFLTDETFWRIVLRVDGQPIMAAPITPRRGGSTLSAFVTLTTVS